MSLHRPPHHPMRPRFPLLLSLLSLSLAAARQKVEASPVVAVPPATLELRTKQSELVGAPLTERVQLALQAAPPLADIEFVTRDALDAAIREQELALAGASADAPAPAVHAVRFVKADWILRLRLRAENIARPRIEAEVVDALRADLLAQADLPLEELPAAHWLLTPNETSVARFTELATRALRAAAEREASLADTRRVAPLVFVDRSPHARLAPLATALYVALGQPRPDSKFHVLDYAAEDAARAESGLFLTGLTSASPADWARVADAYVWGEFTETADYTGPVSDLPVRVKLTIWSDDRGPRPVEVEGRFGDLPALAEKAADAALGLIGEARISDPFTQRATIAALLRDSASELRAKTPAYSAWLLSLADFFIRSEHRKSPPLPETTPPPARASSHQTARRSIRYSPSGVHEHRTCSSPPLIRDRCLAHPGSLPHGGSCPPTLSCPPPSPR